MKTYTGKEIKKGGVWYPVTIEAHNLKEANEKVNKNSHSGEDLRGRFYEEKHFRGKQGGSRPNSGAKPKYNEPTKTITFRVPESKISELKELIQDKLNQWSTMQEGGKK